MAEQSVDALQTRLDALSGRYAEIAEADARLADAMATAHAVTVAALATLDRIEQEIEAAVAEPGDFALDTPPGARYLQRFLLAKHREIIAVVNDARAQADAKTTAVQQLMSSYQESNPASRE